MFPWKDTWLMKIWQSKNLEIDNNDFSCDPLANSLWRKPDFISFFTQLFSIIITENTCLQSYTNILTILRMYMRLNLSEARFIRRISVASNAITKKMTDVHFTRMLCGRKSFKKANGRLLKDRHKTGGKFLRCGKISHH